MGNPLADLPTWTAKAEHMDRVAERYEQMGDRRGYTMATTSAATFRDMAEIEGEQPSCPGS